MENVAVSVLQRRRLILRGGGVLARAVRVIRSMAVVVVGVVAHMGQAGRLFVLAIGGCRNPDGLQRKQHQQEDGDDAAHEQDLSGLFASM